MTQRRAPLDRFVEQTLKGAGASFYSVNMARREAGVDPTVFAIAGIGLLVAGAFGAAIPVLTGDTDSTADTVRLVAGAAMLLGALYLTRHIHRPKPGDRTYEYVAMAVVLLIGVAFWAAMLALLVFSGWYLIADRGETWVTILSAAALCIFGLPLVLIVLLEHRSRQSTEELYGLDVNPADELAERSVAKQRARWRNRPFGKRRRRKRERFSI